jgi:hypothetical protein
MLHFEGHAVELGPAHGNGALDIDGRECDEGGLSRFQGFDYSVQPGYVWHNLNSLGILEDGSSRSKRLNRSD